MPRSQQPVEGEKEIFDRIVAMGPTTKVLDIGAGPGKWSILREHVGVCDAIEVWQPYIDRFKLKTLYDSVKCIDLKNVLDFTEYDVLVLGDVLEHLKHKDAVEVCKRIKEQGVRAYLSIPISLCIHGPHDGNPYEAHLYQWKHEELVALGWEQIHVGFNPNGKVKIGTYVMNEQAS
jgi:hypothetical protein